MDINRALSRTAGVGHAELRRAYAAAVAQGAKDTGRTAAEERVHGPLRLLTLALRRMPDLAVCAYTLEMLGTVEQDAPLASVTGEIAAGVLRLSDLALEVHGREVGYRTGAWVEQALTGAGVKLGCRARPENDEMPVTPAHVRAAAAALSGAAAATAEDRMRVPEQLAEGLGHLLAMYALARAAGR